MSEFDELLKKLREKKPDLDQSAIDELIRQKKAKIGAGYLTDQGALFLIASDMGVTLSESASTRAALKDLYVGAAGVSLEARVMSVSNSKQYSRKDGTPFQLRTMIIYDNDATATVKLWDTQAEFPGVERLQPGDLVRISGANIKTDMNNLPTIHVGSGADIEISSRESDIPPIQSITKDVSTVTGDQRNMVITGILDGAFSTVRFTNSRGQPGMGLKFQLKGDDGQSHGIILWGKDESNLPRMILPNSTVKLLGVNSKVTERGVEISGNESTLVRIENAGDLQPIVARIISIIRSDSGERLLLGVDEQRNLLHVSDNKGSTLEFQEGDIIECMPSIVHGKEITLEDDSYVHKVDDSGRIPQKKDLRTKISEIAAGGHYCIDAIILRDPERRDIQTRTGESVALGETLVGDDSGEMRVVGWRDQARIIGPYTMGDIVTITDLEARAGTDGRPELILGRFSKVTKKT